MLSSVFTIIYTVISIENREYMLVISEIMQFIVFKNKVQVLALSKLE